MSYDKDCSKQFPHRSKIVINKKKYDEYCFSIKKCSEWTDLSKNSKGTNFFHFHHSANMIHIKKCQKLQEALYAKI